MKSSLTLKFILFVAVPLLVQIVLLLHLATLENEAESELRRAFHAKDISDAIGACTKDGLEVVILCSMNNQNSIENISADPTYTELTKKLMTDFENLGLVAGHDTKSSEAALAARNRCQDALSTLSAIQYSLSRAGKSEHLLQKQLWRKIRTSMQEVMLDQELIALGDEQSNIAKQARKKQTELRAQAQASMWQIAACNFLFAIAGAIIFAQGIVIRLDKMRDNMLRFASNVPLSPKSKGDDEIARLDHGFHQMAEGLRHAERREKAILTNARDLICSLDRQGRVIQCNPAVERLFKCKQEELIGRHIIDVVDSIDTLKTFQYLDSLRSATSQSIDANLTIRMNYGGCISHVEWSGQWSSEEQMYIIVIHDISERVEAEASKRELMTMITHDLKSPLTSVASTLQLFARGKYVKLEDKGKELLNISVRSLMRMTALIADFLDLEKIDSGMPWLETKPIDLWQCFCALQDDAMRMAENKDVELDVRETNLVVVCDQNRIARVLNNLVGNAVKFSPRHSKIVVAAIREHDFAVVTVEDDGEGIPSSMLDSIFEKYQQVSDSANASRAGSGLGLFICKSIVEMHGGRIWATSDQGKGSKFTFTLPCVIEKAVDRIT